MRRKQTSRDVLTKSVETRMRHCMVALLEQFDKRFPDNAQGGLFKNDIKNKMNDMIRCTREEMRDYDIEHRPLKIAPDGHVSVTRTFIEALEGIGFSDTPRVQLRAAQDRLQVLQSVRNELGAGIVHTDGEQAYLTISGSADCVNYAVPFLDKYALTSNVRAAYKQWRARLVTDYTGDRNDDES